MNTAIIPAQRAPNTAGRAAWICLVIAWVCFLVPLPGAGLIVGWPLNIVAFILAIVAMSKVGAGGGIWQLLASIIVSPIVYFIGILILAGTIGAASNAAQHDSTTGGAPQPAAEEISTSPAVATDAHALFAAYSANEIAADAQFKGKRIEITGSIENIASDLTDDAVVNLKSDEFQSVGLRGLPNEVAAGLSKGQKITAICTGAGEVIGSPMLDDCSLK